MPRQQRLLKLCILLMMPVAVIASLGAYAGTFWYFFSGERYLSAAGSPSGHFRAVLVEERDSRCEDDRGSANSTFLKVERRAAFLKTGEVVPFCVAGDSTDGLTVRWSGPSELTIDCPKCTDGKFGFSTSIWGEATFKLELPVHR